MIHGESLMDYLLRKKRELEYKHDQLYAAWITERILNRLRYIKAGLVSADILKAPLDYTRDTFFQFTEHTDATGKVVFSGETPAYRFTRRLIETQPIPFFTYTPMATKHEQAPKDYPGPREESFQTEDPRGGYQSEKPDSIDGKESFSASYFRWLNETGRDKDSYQKHAEEALRFHQVYYNYNRGYQVSGQLKDQEGSIDGFFFDQSNETQDEFGNPRKSAEGTQDNSTGAL